MRSAFAQEPLSQDSERASRLLAWLAKPAPLKWAALGLGVYAASLLATLPARLVLLSSGAGVIAEQASGTVWRGGLGLGQGVSARWSIAPLRSVLNLAIATDLAVDGPGTDLKGRGLWRPGSLKLDRVSGRAGGALIAALAPRLPMRCELGVRVDLRTLVLAGRRSGAEGQLLSAPGACRSFSGASNALPALLATATMDVAGSRGFLRAITGTTRLAEASLSSDGKLTAVVRPEGAALLPAGTLSGSLTLETQL